MLYTFGFLGCGNMGSAIAAASRKTLRGDEIAITTKHPEHAAALAERFGARAVSIEEIAAEAQYIFLAVKPQMLALVMEPLKGILSSRTDRFLLVSMVAGVTIERVRELSGGSYPVIRIMPNTPCSVGEGMIQYALSEDVTEEEKAFFLQSMSAAGRLDELDEHLIDAASAVSGCGPAFTDLFAEALADGGVECGLPRAKALEYAAQMLIGSGKLLLESGKHPGELKDAVCSPGGSTIQGVHALESGAFRAAVINAVVAAYRKNKELG